MDTRQDPFEYQMSLSDIQAAKDDTPPPAKPRVSAEKPTPKDADPTVVKGNTTLTGQPADKVVINPTIDPFLMEANEEPVVSPKNGKHAIIVGGFRPFTIAHHELVKHAQRKFEHVHVFTTQSSKRPASTCLPWFARRVAILLLVLTMFSKILSLIWLVRRRIISATLRWAT